MRNQLKMGDKCKLYFHLNVFFFLYYEGDSIYILFLMIIYGFLFYFISYLDNFNTLLQVLDFNKVIQIFLKKKHVSLSFLGLSIVQNDKRWKTIAFFPNVFAAIEI